LHGISHPTEDIDVIPTLFRIATWGVIVDANGVMEISIEFRVPLGFEYGI
jgi:hypothetical protein